MEQISPKKGVLILEGVAIVIIALLILIDLGIKNDLIQAAQRLERKLNDAAGRMGETDNVSDIHGDIFADVPIHTENNDHASMEMETIPAPRSDEVAAILPKKSNSAGRKPRTRIQESSNEV